MKTKHAIHVVAALSLVLAAPAFAGGDHCSGKTSATTASAAHGQCSGKASAAAWAGAWLQRSESGAITVAEVAQNSPAARSGLRAGDVVLAVNGRQLGTAKAEGMCMSSAECSVGRTVAYTVQRGRSIKVLTLKLAKMPADATERFANRDATFDPTLASVVMTTIN